MLNRMPLKIWVPEIGVSDFFANQVGILLVWNISVEMLVLFLSSFLEK